jgi:hypothetical protein
VALGDRVASRWCLLLLEVVAPSKLARRLCEAPKKLCWGGIVLTPWGSRRATLVERVIELPHLMVGSCGALWESLVVDTD